MMKAFCPSQQPRDIRQPVCGVCKKVIITTHKTQKYHLGECQAEAKKRREERRVRAK